MAATSEQPLIIGHRAAAGLAPENTAAAFAAAIAVGLTWVETDVRLTADAVPVLVHDAFCANLQIAASSYRDLCAVHPELLTLPELLDRYAEVLCFNLEVKDPQAFAAVGKLVREHNLTRKTLVSSFHHPGLRSFAQAYPDIAVAPLVASRPLDPTQLASAWRPIARLIVVSADFCDVDMLQEFAAAGLSTWLYAVETPAQVAAFIQAGCAGLIVDHPQRFLPSLMCHYRPHRQ